MSFPCMLVCLRKRGGQTEAAHKVGRARGDMRGGGTGVAARLLYFVLHCYYLGLAENGTESYKIYTVSGKLDL